MDKALKGEETSNFEVEFRNKDNEIRHILLNATSRRDENAKIVGVLGVAQDVTEVTQHDREVAAMANELRQLINTANAPIFGEYLRPMFAIWNVKCTLIRIQLFLSSAMEGINVDGKVNEWNNKTSEITGYSQEEAMGKHLGKISILFIF